MIVIRSLEEAEDLLLGASILATGGGGSLDFGLELLKEVLNEGAHVKIQDLNEFDVEGVLVSPYFVGSMGSLGERSEAKVKDMLLKAMDVIEGELGEKVRGFISSELGGSNTAVPLYASALTGLPLVDGDLMGRAGPELHQSTAHIFNVKVIPSVIVSPKDTIVVVKSISGIDDYESIARHIAFISNGWGLVVDTPITRDDAEKIVIKETLSFSMKLGKSIREARSKGFQVTNVIAEVLNGWMIFEGLVSKVELVNTGRFLEGTIEIDDGRSKLKIYVKNEYLLAWLNNIPLVICPDLIILVNEEGYPILSNMVREGMKVAVLAAKAPEVWRTKRGLELFGPRRFGFNIEYKPVEDLLKNVYMR